MRTLSTKTCAINYYNGLGNQLWDLAGDRPSLDLRFADDKSLVDATSGKSLVTHTRASNATYVGGDGLIKDATTNYLLYSEEFDNASWVNSSTTEDPNAGIAPDGTTTADKLLFDSGVSGASCQILQDVSGLLASTTYVVSIYLKAGEASKARIGFVGRTAASGFIGQVLYDFTLSGAGTDSFVGTSGTAPTNHSAAIVAVGDGWYRCSITATTQPTAAIVRLLVAGDNVDTGTGTNGFFMWGAQVEQSSTVGEYIPTTSTINSAPRFDHDPETGESLGLLVEESRTNLLSGSEEFDDASWTRTTIGNFGTVSFPNATTSPDGKQTADLIVPTSGGLLGIAFVSQAITKPAAATTYTLSCFGKKQSFDVLRIFARDTATNNNRVEYAISLDNGSVVTAPTAVGTFTAVSGSVVSYTNGWYRAQLTFTTSTETNITTRIYANDSIATVGDDVSGIYIWGAQLEEGSFPTSYIPTNGSTVTRAADITQISGNDFGTFNLLQYSEEFDQDFYPKIRCSVTPNVALAPNNTFTADAIVEDTSTSTHILQADGGNNPVSGVTYTYSWHLKAGERTALRIAFGTDNSVWQDETVDINLSDGVVSNVSGFATTPVVQNAGNGWYRLSATVTAQASGNGVVRMTPLVGGSISYTGDGTSKYFIWGAQLEESSTATPYVKSDVTWSSRGSNATYYDKDGVLRKSSYNLLLWSEEFDNSYWGKINGGTGSAPVLTPGFDAPDGTATAYRLQADAGSTTGSGNYSLLQKGVTLPTGNYTTSVWLKSNTGSNQNVYFRINSDNLVVVTTEWQRFEISENTSNHLHSVGTRGDTGSDVSIDILVWGAQLETGPYAGDYAKTEGSAASTARNVAFLPDGSGNFVSAGELLLEDAGTNLLEYSEEFDRAYWVKTGVTVTADSVISPDGTQTADFLQESSSTGRHDLYNLGSVSLTSQPYTFSLYVKPNGRNWIKLRLDGPALFKGVFFNLTGNGAVGTADTGFSGSITNVGNGWYKCEITKTIVNGSYYAAPRLADADGSDEYQGDGASGVYIWGAQLEANSYPTSYIPTYGSTATRAADVSTSSSNTFGNSFYDQEKGTVFVNTRPQDLSSAAFRSIWEIGSDNSNWMSLERNGSYPQRGTIRSQVAGVQQYSLTPNQTPNETWSGELFANVAFAYKENSFANYSPSNYAIASSGLVPSATELKIGPYEVAHFKRLTYWPTRLSNDTLQQITT